MKKISKKETAELIEKAQNSDYYMNMLIKQYSPAVYLNAHRYKKDDSVQLEDLAQEGFIGLFKAAKRYDKNNNASFLTWATHYISGYIRNFINKENKHIKNVPINDFDHILILKESTEEDMSFSHALGKNKLPDILTVKELTLIKAMYNLSFLGD